MKVQLYSAAVVVATLLLVMVMVMVMGEGQVAMAAVTCSPVQLSSCANAIISSSPPSELCCTKIREQAPCLCQYMRDPTLSKFINTPNARKVAASCGTPFPKC
ncbi:hypothetical protein Nepgr_018899 [Nepenthes gracilis]|uniref:Bifunctional inhibitor/plant lipid transfer protein/seed storage helical domain-containing protein n=1 Tax=Nepenthes gracilis TaxID=150966 RepID=A0AAD3SS73_NEPGR|nr:hypothetical protein Nepgr_018899 [Nepenthes gracilis]